MELFNSYLELGEGFYEKTRPTTVAAPQLLLWNQALAEDLGLPPTLTTDPTTVAEIFSGNRLLPNVQPIALAYAGHQFGYFVPQLGDGRAHLLGEVIDQDGVRRDIQLKGSGQTRYSRNGDGRCALGPAVREFIMSEALHALRVPTSRCLAVVTTGENVSRETPQPGAVVTRVASSHLRVGTFEYFAARRDVAALLKLANYAIERHYPHVQGDGPQRFVALLEQVVARQIRLIVEWMRVGFIHGVMNTDNTALSGETIDFGPCAMLGIYDPQTVYSSIDTFGRYAFGNQPKILQWNMARFAECLLPLIDDEPRQAMTWVEPIIEAIPKRFEDAFLAMMAKKLGLVACGGEDKELIVGVLQRLEDQALDYTLIFNRLPQSVVNDEADERLKKDLGPWFERWQTRLQEQGDAALTVQQRMRQSNPVVIPRNHHVEAAIRECEQTGKTTLTETFLQVLRAPYEEQEHTAEFQDPPADGDRFYQTFCGT
nr:YdiU family protein [uncultured Desulfuromonas sp.]